MSIAEAINYKNLIPVKKSFILHLKDKYTRSKAELERQNTVVDKNVQAILEATFGKENVKVTDSDIESVQKPYLQKNQFHLVDPLNIEKTISQLENEVMEFESEVDSVLSEINAITEIAI
jgi:hypothetical protein